MALIVRFSKECYFNFDEHNLYFCGEIIKGNVSKIPHNIVQVMANSPEVVFSKGDLIEHCWPTDAGIESRSDSTVRSTISRIKNWHNDVAAHFITIRGKGYKYKGDKPEDITELEKECSQGDTEDENSRRIHPKKNSDEKPRAFPFELEEIIALVRELIGEKDWQNMKPIEQLEKVKIYLDFHSKQFDPELLSVEPQRTL